MKALTNKYKKEFRKTPNISVIKIKAGQATICKATICKATTSNITITTWIKIA
jgi:hypothetical protein